jgi:beta-phosphoglucomutase family hydrolase
MSRTRDRNGKAAHYGLPSRIEACLFDLDGVLTQTAALHAVAWKALFDDFLRMRAWAIGDSFAPFDPIVDYGQYVDGKLRMDGARAFLASRDIHLSDSQLIALAERKDGIFLRLLQEQPIEKYEGSVRYVAAVHQGGLKTAVVTSSRHGQKVLSAAGLEGLFDVRIDGEIAAEKKLAGKPAPDTYLAAAYATGMPPKAAAVFEDAIAGVEAGRAGRFGWVVGVDRLGHAEELRTHGADVVVDDLSRLLEST